MAELKLGTTIGGSVAWHEGNDGSGSGLDADYLDGNHASAFALSGHTHSYLSAESDTLASVTGRGASTATMLTLTGSSASGGGSAGTASIQIQGLSAYQSLELGISGNYDGMLRTYGNDMKYYAGHWRSTATATENHSHYWYTSKSGSTNWTTAKMSLNHDGDLMTLGRHTLGTFPSSTSNSGEAWIGRASDRSAGTMTVQLGGDNTRVFEVVDYAWTTVILSAGMNGFTYKGNTVYHSGNIPSYLTGNQTITLSGDVSGSGSTSISVTVNQIDGQPFANTMSNSAVNANTLEQNGITYYQSGVDNFSGNSTDGALYSQAYSSSWQHQIAGDYREGNIAVRGKNSGTWSRWKPVATITISDTAPANETRGDLWWESDTGKLKIWYADGTSEQWVDAVPIPDTSTFFSKAGGAITGPVTMSSSLNITGLTVSKKTNLYANGAGWDDGLNLYSSDVTNRWNLLVDSGASNRFRLAYNGSEKFYVNTSGDAVAASSMTTGYYNVTPGEGYAIRFWSSSSYAIAMGSSSTYQYGTVTDYSIKTCMDNGSPGRGFTWGRESYAPIASLNATSGNFQTAGTIYAGGNITAYSDIKLKTNILTIDNPIEKVKALRGITYNRIDQDQERRQTGVIAQDVEKVLPEAVIEDNMGIKTVAYGNMVGLLIEAIKEQQKQIDELKAEVKAFKG